MTADGAPPSAATARVCLVPPARRRASASVSVSVSDSASGTSPTRPRYNRSCATAFRWSGILLCNNVHNTGDALLGVLDLLLCLVVPAMGYAYAAELHRIAEEQESFAGNQVGTNQTA